MGAGAWMYHCHVQSHSDMGMAGLLLIKKPDGTIPGYEPHHHTAGATEKKAGEKTGDKAEKKSADTGAAEHQH
ncbi:multicopper oxidase domain-containing protein [Streptomyces] [Streptomyces griseus]